MKVNRRKTEYMCVKKKKIHGHVLYQFNMFFLNDALPRASPDLLPRYSIMEVTLMFFGHSRSFSIL